MVPIRRRSDIIGPIVDARNRNRRHLGMTAFLAHHSYGKSRVRLTRITRLPDRHEIRELTVDIRLEGDFDASYLAGDNSRIIATDTMKNVVYSLAQGRPAEAIEEFAAILAGHFVDGFPQVRSATIGLAEHPWRRIAVDGVDHPHAFVGGGSERRTATITRTAGQTRVESGLDGLLVLKTTGSGFSGFLRDRYTTLPETTDRIFATEIQGRWTYAPGVVVDWDRAHAEVRRALLETFAGHDSLAVQQTLFAMGKAALGVCPEIEEITLTLPNQHRIPFDLQRFGQANANEIFVATDEPFGLISGTIRRG
jgi:urate oxidase